MPATGYVVISIRRTNDAAFSILETGAHAQRLKYDDATGASRAKVIKLAKDVVSRWGSNYAQFRDAAFRIETIEKDTDGFDQRTLISGPAYEARTTPKAPAAPRAAHSFLYPALNTALNIQGWHRRVAIRSTPSEWDADEYRHHADVNGKGLSLYRDGQWSLNNVSDNAILSEGLIASGLPV